MELIEGRSLALAIPKGGLPLADLLTIAISLADAIAAAHAKGVTHRVSPDQRSPELPQKIPYPDQKTPRDCTP
jgi:hypothetical protein